MSERPTGTVTFLFTDIEGSTRLWDERPGEMARSVERHDQILRACLEDHGGYVFTTAGDSFAAAFSSPMDALSAALSAQSTLASEHWDVGKLLVRMGLHMGVAHERDGDYFGPAVNRTARVMSAGHGGQVLVSGSVADLLREGLPDGVGLRDLGEHRLSDLADPERLHQVQARGLRDGFPPLRVLDAVQNNLPVDLSSFVGRSDETADAIERLASSRLVTLTGVGGSGKTRLALHVAAEQIHAFPGGVWLVELAALSDPEDLGRYVVEALGLGRRASSGGEELPDSGVAMRRLIEFFGERTTLLVLDNCEHLISVAARLVDGLLRGCPGLRVLATSREGLGVRGEQLVQVPALSVEFDRQGGSTPDALELFAERAAAASSAFRLTPDLVPTVAEICRRLDGMPLAIELAAARVRFLPVDEISARLSDAFRILSGGARTALPRQQTLHATIDWSYDLLSDEEQHVFARLGVFRGGFELAAAEATVHGDPVEEWAVFDLVADLVSKSMVQVERGGTRFRLLETLRQYALERLRSDGVGDEWRRRHAEYFAALANEAYDGLRDHRQAEWFDRIDLDHENYRAAIGWSLEAGETRLAARLVRGIWWYWFARSEVVYGKGVLTAIIESGDLDHELLTQMIQARAWTNIFERPEDGLEDAEAAARMASSIEDDRLRARMMVALVPVLGALGRFDEEQSVFEEAYAAGQRAGDEWVLGRLALNHGYALEFRASGEDDPIVETAEQWSLAALRHFRASGVQLGLAHTTSSRARRQAYGVSGTKLRSGPPDGQAAVESPLALFSEARDLFLRLGDLRQAGFCDMNIARIQFAVGNLEDAAHAASRGRAALERVGNAVAYATSIEGTVLATLGHLEDTRACLLRGKGGLREEGPHVHVAFAILLAWLAEQSGLLIEAGRLAAAIEGVPPGEVDLGLLSIGLCALLAGVSERLAGGGTREAISHDELVPLLEVIMDVAPGILATATRR